MSACSSVAREELINAALSDAPKCDENCAKKAVISDIFYGRRARMIKPAELYIPSACFCEHFLNAARKIPFKDPEYASRLRKAIVEDEENFRELLAMYNHHE